MRKSAAEAWAAEVIDSVVLGHKVEDDNVELKREISDVAKAARRLAGHANSALGADVLWLIGIDEDAPETVGASFEPSRFLDQLESWFDDRVAPEPVHVIRLPHPLTASPVTAIVFATDRAPYVVKGPADKVEREVPWRSGTRVRPASRRQLLQMIRQVEALPEVMISSAEMGVEGNAERQLRFRGRATVFISPARGSGVLSIPGYNIVARLFSPAAPALDRVTFEAAASEPDHGDAAVISRMSADGVRVTGAGHFTFHLIASEPASESTEAEIRTAAQAPLRLQLSITAIETGRAVVSHAEMRPNDPPRESILGRWVADGFAASPPVRMVRNLGPWLGGG
ncbi:MAG: helix-turn-helix domain-containing protein [Acidimicrobiia bacterium]